MELKSGQYFVVVDDHTGTLGISFFTEDEQSRRIPLLCATQADAQREIDECISSCKEAVNLGYMQDYDDDGYYIAYATLAGEHLLVSINDYVVYEGSVFEVDA